MDVAHWTDSSIDGTRARRLTIGYLMAAAIMVGGFAAIAASSPAPTEVEEAPLDVVFGEVPEEEEAVEEEEQEPVDEPEPPPTREPVKNWAPAPAGPKPVAIDTAPTAVPTTDAAETTPTPGDIRPGGDPNQDPGGGGTGPPGPVTPPAPPPPAPQPPKPKPKPKKKKKKKKPVRITEGMTPPKRVSGGGPSYPKSAKAQGIEGTVVVVYVVTASGSVSGAKAVRGPAALRGVCVAAVSGWRFTPAKDAEGNPVSARRIAKFPFRIRTK